MMRRNKMFDKIYEWRKVFDDGAINSEYALYPFTDDIEFIKKMILDNSPTNYFILYKIIVKKYNLAIPTSIYQKARQELVDKKLLVIDKSYK